MVRTVAQDVLPTHLLLGTNATEMSEAYSREQLEESVAWSAVSRSADFGAPYPVARPTEQPAG